MPIYCHYGANDVADNGQFRYPYHNICQFVQGSVFHWITSDLKRTVSLFYHVLNGVAAYLRSAKSGPELTVLQTVFAGFFLRNEFVSFFVTEINSITAGGISVRSVHFKYANRVIVWIGSAAHIQTEVGVYKLLPPSTAEKGRNQYYYINN